MFDPLGCSYSAFMSIRNRLFDQGTLVAYQSSLPVISIGNITVGGNGKTPLAICIAKHAIRLEPVILTRGYKGRNSEPRIVESGDSPDLVGDEAVVLKNNLSCPIVVARDRVAGAKFIESRNLGKVIILDDGLQHRWLNRNVDLIAIDASNHRYLNNIIAGKTFPFGRCREKPVQAFRRASGVVLTDRGGSAEFMKVKFILNEKFGLQIPFFKAEYKLEKVVSAVGDFDIATKEVVAFCGLASPDSFYMLLEKNGFKLSGHKSFPDHHFYTDADIEEIRGMAGGKPIVCTQKDLVKFNSDNSYNIFSAQIRLDVTALDSEADFFEFLTSKIP